MTWVWKKWSLFETGTLWENRSRHWTP